MARTSRCYRGCGRRARWVVGDPNATMDRGAAWPVCTRHIRAGLRTARRWKHNGINASARARVWRDQ